MLVSFNLQQMGLTVIFEKFFKKVPNIPFSSRQFQESLKNYRPCYVKLVLYEFKLFHKYS